jgi:hypothetical protein
METHLAEEALWAEGVAARLRLVHASFADDDPVVRQNCLRDEIERSVKAVAPSRRELHLRALTERFPAWGTVTAEVTPRSVEGAAAPESPEELLERLLEAAAPLPEAQKAELAQRLQQAGLIPKASAAGAMESPPEFGKRFGIVENKPLNPERSLRTLVALTDVFLALDQLVWTLWRQLNGKSIYRKEAEFAKLAGPYLTGDGEVSTEQMRQPLEKTRRLIAALLGAMGRGPSIYARKHSTDISPESIEVAARLEKKAFESLEAASWRKFKELYREFGAEQMVEAQMLEAVGRAAEDLISGRGR